MTAGVWLTEILLIAILLVLVLRGLPAAKRARIGSAVRGLIRRFGKAGSASTENAPESRGVIERNQDLIAKSLGQIGAISDVHYVESQVRFCIADIARREGKPHFAPEHEWLSQWEQRPNIPFEYRELKNHLIALFQARHTEALKQKQQQEAAERMRVEDLKALKREELVARNQDLIDRFLELAERRVSITDDYGDENWGILPNEIMVCIRKICEKEQYRFDWEQYAKEKRGLLSRTHPGGRGLRDIHWWAAHSHCLLCGTTISGQLTTTCPKCGGRCVLWTDRDVYMEEFGWLEKELEERFRRFHEDARSKSPKEMGLPRISGEEFEAKIAKWLRSHGYDVAGTPKTGDQGADLVVRKSGKRIVIQAKYYQGSVGNSSVQEVISAVKFYEADEGWVITNSTFTASAKALAQKAGIKLIDGRALETGGGI